MGVGLASLGTTNSVLVAPPVAVLVLLAPAAEPFVPVANVVVLELEPPAVVVNDAALMPPVALVDDVALVPPAALVDDAALMPPVAWVSDAALVPPIVLVADVAFVALPVPPADVGLTFPEPVDPAPPAVV
jgi:hypothetical protein